MADQQTPAPLIQGFPCITREVWDFILEHLREGYGLMRICREFKDLPARSRILAAIAAAPKEMQDEYARAMDDGADAMVEEAGIIADDGRNDTQVDEEGKTTVNYDHIQRSKLRVEQRRWHAGKLRPKKWGDRLQIDDISAPKLEDAKAALAEYVAAMTAESKVADLLKPKG